MMNFSEIPEFTKEFKCLQKKYLSLSDDLHEFKKIISVVPQGHGKHFHTLGDQNKIKIIKARFFCRYLKGNSLRIIYAFHETDNFINFLEIYSKNAQINENRIRISNYLNQKRI